MTGKVDDHIHSFVNYDRSFICNGNIFRQSHVTALFHYIVELFRIIYKCRVIEVRDNLHLNAGAVGEQVSGDVGLVVALHRNVGKSIRICNNSAVVEQEIHGEISQDGLFSVLGEDIIKRELFRVSVFRHA